VQDDGAELALQLRLIWLVEVAVLVTEPGTLGTALQLLLLVTVRSAGLLVTVPAAFETTTV
jgi:hypothetical protein